jgi:hypothetical protein
MHGCTFLHVLFFLSGSHDMLKTRLLVVQNFKSCSECNNISACVRDEPRVGCFDLFTVNAARRVEKQARHVADASRADICAIFLQQQNVSSSCIVSQPRPRSTRACFKGESYI